jgi:hypothetical protein
VVKTSSLKDQKKRLSPPSASKHTKKRYHRVVPKPKVRTGLTDFDRAKGKNARKWEVRHSEIHTNANLVASSIFRLSDVVVLCLLL